MATLARALQEREQVGIGPPTPRHECLAADADVIRAAPSGSRQVDSRTSKPCGGFVRVMSHGSALLTVRDIWSQGLMWRLARRRFVGT